MLKEYAEKRRFERTPEPGPAEHPSSRDEPLRFVVQKHAATRLHYDFRIELGGALVSWAVPKGPSLNPQDKRLAVKVEDHPLDYQTFEGTIPQGEYGGGEVIIWDRGTYTSKKVSGGRAEQEAELQSELDRGLVEVELDGEKLRGGFAIVRREGNQWFLIKMRDDEASEEDILKDSRSVVSGRRIGGVPEAAKGPLPPPLPDLRPMLLTEAEHAFDDAAWSFELKLDGVRILAYLRPDGVRAITRYGNDATAKLPTIMRELGPYGDRNAIIDGEIVVLDEEGKPSFQNLMEGFQAGTARTAQFWIFDILFLDGKDLRKLPWTERRKLLEELNPKGPHLRVLDTFSGDGKILLQHAIALGFEGIVGKRKDSRYEDGRRSKGWVKVKGYKSEEFVIGGYTPGRNARDHSFGALLLGKPAEKGLKFVGNVGGGFSDRKLGELRATLDQMRIPDRPFIDDPGIKGAVWVKPDLVAEVRYQSWTKEERLRFPVFLRLRSDLEPEDVLDGVPARAERKHEEPAEQGAADAFLAELAAAEKEARIKVDSQVIHFTNLDKELWPGVRKRDLVTYYATVSETLLPYLVDRPLSFVRCPEGVEGHHIFQKHMDKGRPDYVRVANIYSGSNEGARDYVICDNLPTLLWLGQMASVELNPWMSRVAPDGEGRASTDFSSSKEALEDSVLNRPDYLIFDLDPHFGGKATGWKQAEWELLADAAMEIKAVLQTINLKGFPKSSGKSGLHIYVPIERDLTYDQIRSAGFTIGQEIVRRMGAKVTLEYSTRKRPDAVFIDVNQNIRGKTMAGVYSPRAALGAGVSMPLAWGELHRVDPTQFTVLTAPDRLRQKGDFWAELRETHQRLVA